jgi:hypothetical protein
VFGFGFATELIPDNCKELYDLEKKYGSGSFIPLSIIMFRMTELRHKGL